jgi:hypothetical protein
MMRDFDFQILKRELVKCPMWGSCLHCLVDYFHEHKLDKFKTSFQSKRIGLVIGDSQ